MVILGAITLEACDFATRCKIIGAKIASEKDVSINNRGTYYLEKGGGGGA